MNGLDNRIIELRARQQAAIDAEAARLAALNENQRIIDQADAEIAGIEWELRFEQLQTMTAGQGEYYAAAAALDTEIKQLQERLQELTAQRSDMEHLNHVPMHRRIELRQKLNETASPEQRARLYELDRMLDMTGTTS